MKLPKEIREQFRALGKKGGQTRAANLSAARRAAIAKKAAHTRHRKAKTAA